MRGLDRVVEPAPDLAAVAKKPRLCWAIVRAFGVQSGLCPSGKSGLPFSSAYL
jgi:hypothetical protein